MSSRLTRKDIKRDEILETLGGFVGFLNRHGKTIGLVLAAVIVLAVGVVIFRVVSSGKEEVAGRELGRALIAYNAPIAADSPQPDDPRAPSFADESSRSARAQELFSQVAEQYSGTVAGDIAGAYLGSLASTSGDLETAREHWERFVARQEGHLLAAEIRLNLMALDRGTGRGSELVDELRAELSSARSDLPEVVLLSQLALTLESLGRTEEAVDIYERLVQDFPLSPYSRSANQRIAALEAPTS